MPKFDKTGPTGKGPKTGRGLGRCPETSSNNSNVRYGLGRKQIIRRNKAF